MALFFPLAHADIDWDRGYEFLDKELQRITRDATLGRRYADKLVKVWRKTGEEQWVLIHIEIQGQHETKFNQRMYIYNYRLFDHYKRLVASFAVLCDEGKRWRPKKFSYKLWGCKISFEFPIVKLIDYRTRWAELEASDNVFAVVIMAQLKAQETRHDPEARFSAKFYLARRLYERGYTREKIINLFHFIDWIMQLPEPLETKFWQDLQAYEEVTHMRYVTSVERIGMAKGMEKGIEEGMEKGMEKGLQQGALRQLMRLLHHRFQVIPEAVQTRLQLLSVEQLEQLLDVALTVTTIPDFVARVPEPIEVEAATA